MLENDVVNTNSLQQDCSNEEQTTTTTTIEDTEKQQQSDVNKTSNNGQVQRSKQMEHLQRIREQVKKAIAAKHTFMIHGRARIVRECLLARHWCEKLPRKSGPPSAELQQLGVDSSASVLLAGIGDLSEPHNEKMLISKMLTNHIPDLLWNAGSDWAGWPAQDNKTTIFNRFTRANFTSKIGLCSNVRQMHWYYEAGIANTLFPRCYNISQSDQMQAFVDDFRITACLSLLKWLLEKASTREGEESLCSPGGSTAGLLVPLRALDFAIGRCSDLIGSRCHEDIDHEPEKVWSHQWEQFVGWYYKLVHQGASFVAASPSSLHKYVTASRHLLRKLKALWPQLDMDGSLNIWILKPGNKSRGRGIVLMNRLDDILAKLNPANKTNDTRFVVQKYIERPLLIHDTKFDIRQWFIVTCAQPLTLWMYRESYLRFCSQKFSLRDFHESIHLSNNAVQCKYKNSPERDPALPSDNMWDVATFKQFLAARGDPNAWEQLIYPGMKQGLVGSLLASQEAMDRRKNSFELYGADFMLMEDYSVWLIEINSHPDMSNSTSVTSRLCRKAIEDTIKVVVDYRENREGTADTGDFELVYKQKLSYCQAYLGTGLSLHGTRIQASADKRPSGFLGCSPQALSPLTPSPASAKKKAQPPTTNSTPALIDLIEELELQLDHEFYEYVKLRQTSGLARHALPLAPAPAPVENPIIICEQLDAQTNTAMRSIDLGIVQSISGQPVQPQSSLNALNLPDQLPPTATAKSSPRTNSLRLRNSASPHKNHRTNLISKIIDLQKQPPGSNGAQSALPYKSAFKPRTAQLNQTPHSSVPSGQLVKLERSAPPQSKDGKPQQQQKNSERLIASKFMPPITTSNKLHSTKSRTKDKKLSGQSRKHSRIATSQVLLDVTDMYAIGLAVNK